MGWRDRIAASADAAPNPPEGTSVAFVSTPDGHSRSIENPSVAFGGEQDDHSGNIGTLRDQLLAIAEQQGKDASLVHALSESDLHALATHFARLPADRRTDVALALLSMRDDDAARREGRAPAGDTAAILCATCGLVWVHPSIAAVLPIVDGWPRALGCPWCHVHPRAGLAIPRPAVTCSACTHYQPDVINPAQGMGRCAIEATTSTTWPHQARTCALFEPKTTML